MNSALLWVFDNLRYNYVEKHHPNRNWTHAVHWAQATSAQKSKANLRTITPFEVIYDCEDKSEQQHVLNGLDKDRVQYMIWETGSRGWHNQAFYSELGFYPIAIRNRIRKLLIQRYGSDETKSSELTFLACGNAPHFKTGNMKRVVKACAWPVNKLPPEIVAEATEKEEDIAIQRHLGIQGHDLTAIIKWCCEHKIPGDCDRNTKLFKNLAVFMVNSGYSQEEIVTIDSKITANCEGRMPGEIERWSRWARQKPREVCLQEVWDVVNRVNDKLKEAKT